MQYLYGLRYFPGWSEDGHLIVKSEPIERHELAKKIIPSSFFDQKDTEYISAVIFSNSGTYAKFLRIGYQAGYHRGNLKIVRRGTYYDSNPDAVKPLLFAYELDERPIPETWGEGLMVFHNPNAIYPIKKGFFIDAGETCYYDGQTHTFIPNFYPYMSQTVNVSYRRGPIDDPDENAGLPIQSILKSEFHTLFSAEYPIPDIIAVEKEWFANRNRTVIGTILLDTSDNDWSYVILQKESAGIFRWIDGEVSLATNDIAREQLLKKLGEIQ